MRARARKCRFFEDFEGKMHFFEDFRKIIKKKLAY